MCTSAKMSSIPAVIPKTRPRKNVAEDDSVSKAPRAPKARCKSGCITCRIRRVKCDEQKPSCVRCVSTGRKCDGYQQQEKIGQAVPTRLARTGFAEVIICNPGFPGTAREKRSLQYFKERTIVALSGYFSSDFWHDELLPMSIKEPTVRLAVLALSSMHEGFEVGGDLRLGTTQVGPQQRFALQQYNRAVSHTLQSLASKDAERLAITLVTAPLFIFTELTQYDYDAAISHMGYGFRILSGLRTKLANASGPVTNNLNQVYARILIQTIFLGAPHISLRDMPYLGQDPLPQQFQSLSDARDALDGLYISVYPELCATWHRQRNSEDIVPTKQTRRDDDFKNWSGTFALFVEKKRKTFSPRELAGVKVLQISYTALIIIWATISDPSTEAFRPLTPYFQSIVDLAGGLLDSGSLDCIKQAGHALIPQLLHFTFDAGIMGPLFYTALKCRSPDVREKAVALLRHPHIPRREGIWGAAMTVMMAERVIEVENELSRSRTSKDTDQTRRAGFIAHQMVIRSGLLAEEMRAADTGVWFEKPIGDARVVKISEVSPSKEMITEGTRREEWVEW